MFVTSEGRPGARLQRALAARNLTAAEQAAFEIAFVSLAQARELVELYAEKGDPKYERAALQYLARYLAEGNPSLADVAQIAAVLAERGLLIRGLSAPGGLMGARMVTPRRAAPSGWKAIERLDVSLPQNGEFLGIDEGDCVELFAEDAVDRLAVIVERVLRRHEVEILDAHVFSLSWDGTSLFRSNSLRCDQRGLRRVNEGLMPSRFKPTTSTSATSPSQNPTDRGRVLKPTATAASPATRAPTSPTRTTVTPTPTSHDHDTAHKTSAAMPSIRDD